MKRINRLWLSLSLFSTFTFFMSCDPTTKTEVLPMLTTTEVSAITIITATCGGNITADGGTSVIARGICWSTNATPTIADSKTNDGAGNGSFTSLMIGLAASSTYFVRAYASTTAGTGYGSIYQFTTKTNPSTNIQTALIPAGTFIMGSPTTPTAEVNRSPDETQHLVTLSAFRMSKYEITNAQYAAFLNAKGIGSNGVYAAGAYPTQALIYPNSDWGLTYYSSQWVPVTGCEYAPVTEVTWYGSKEFATYVGGTLPTEAQWEYACRAGTITSFNTGNFLTNLQANYNWGYTYNNWGYTYNNGTDTVKTYPGKPQTVGTYAPNAYGLYDMHGNVWEWCADWYGAYSISDQTNPTGPAIGSDRVLRGGGWYGYGAQDCRSAARSYCTPDSFTSGFGFRVVFLP